MIMKLQINSRITFLLLSFLVAVSSSAQCNEPTGIVVDNVTSVSAELNWTASSSAPGIAYRFEVRTSGAPGSGVTGLVDGGSVEDGIFSSSLSGLSSNTAYSVYMRFQCSTTPVFSNWTTAVTFVSSVIPAPTAGAPAGLSDTFFSARWIAVPGATGYRLDVSEFSDFSVLLSGYNNLFVSEGVTSKLVFGLNPSTDYYYRVRAEGNNENGPVTSANSNVILVTTLDVPSFVAVWSAGAWVNNVFPTIDHDVILDDHFVSDVSNEYMFEVKSLTLNEGYTFTMKSGFYLNVAENIVNNSLPGSFIVENNANLVQLNDVAPANVGQITVKRNSSAIFRLDYTMWSSPVTGTQTLKAFSPQTVNNRFYDYTTATDIFTAVDPLTTTFTPGKGYFIRSANNHVANNGTNLAQTWAGSFVGVPTNGIVNVDLNTTSQGFNLVGNPYPSVISADVFIGANTSNIDGTLYFWRRKNDASGLGDTGSFYATYTEFGGIGSDSSDDPNGFIQVGQGFLIKALSSELLFDSTMKVPDEFTNQFFRTTNTSSIEKHRVWINLTNENGVFSKMLMGYAEGASNEKDRMDGRYINDSGVALTSLLDNLEYSIQAKALPFSVEDSFPLSFKVVTAGVFTIAVDHVDGLFGGGQLVYLEDTFTTIVHDLSTSPYTFTAEAGDYKSRFVVRFSNQTMSLNENLNADAVVVFTKDNAININTGTIQMQSLVVFDVQGRKLFSQEELHTAEFTIQTLAKRNQVILLQIKDVNNNVVTKKVVF